LGSGMSVFGGVLACGVSNKWRRVWGGINICCRSKPTGKQRQATRGTGRLLGLLVGPGPSVNGPGSGTQPGVWVASRVTWPCTWSGRCRSDFS
jgi:hypothetical protein